MQLPPESSPLALCTCYLHVAQDERSFSPEELNNFFFCYWRSRPFKKAIVEAKKFIKLIYRCLKKYSQWDIKHNLKKTVVYPCSLEPHFFSKDGFWDVIISHYHVLNGWVNRERGWPLGELSGCQALRRVFLTDSLHDPEWVPEQSLWPLTFSIHKMWITLVIPFGYQFPLGKQRCSLPHHVFLPILSFTICSPVLHLSPISKDYPIRGPFVNTDTKTDMQRNKYQTSSF